MKNEFSRKCPGSSQNVSRVSGRLQNTTEINFEMTQNLRNDKLEQQKT
jgi:hypothetical protein